MPNVGNNGRLHDVSIPAGAEGLEIAPFIWYDFYTDSPELLATHGRGCSIHSSFLHARPKPYDLPVMTKKERFLFRTKEAFTPLLDRAVELEGDITLRAEVHHHCHFTMRAERLARQIRDLCQEMAEVRVEVHESE